MEASCWVERKIFLSPASASSSARTLASRPTMNGVICCGKMTISRTGIIGTRFKSCFSRLNMRAPEKFSNARSGLSGLFEQTPIDLPAADHFRGDDKIAHLALHREVIHKLEHQVFQNHAQSASANFALHGEFGNGF